MALTQEDFDKFVELIFRRTGIWFEQNKRYYVEKRIFDRMAQLGIDSCREYYFLLKFAADTAEVQTLINNLTVNETYFFRDFPQLQGFAECILPEVVKKKTAQGSRKIKIWSAGCSTGEEPYTLAIILLEMLPEPEKWSIDILATDINSKVLDAARKGFYNSRSVKDVPPEYLGRYFTKRWDLYLINLNVQNLVQFKLLNLMEEPAMRAQTELDFVFCRNVLIYFNPESREKVLDNFYRSLASGGYIYLGHSESVGRITEAFMMKRVEDHIVYHKP